MPFHRKAALLSAAFLLLTLDGCTAQPWLSPQEKAENIAKTAGFELRKIATPQFQLTTFQAAAPLGSDTLTVYIEGDGAPWISSSRPPGDPTPLTPVSLILASKDSRRPVLYIGRPCQYLDETELASCHVKYWTSARFAPEVIEALDSVITKVKTAGGARQVRLIGFSGGGVIAALLAARRKDMESLVTVAAPLDTDAWSAFHQISPLRGSLNPMDFIRELSPIRQTHLFGEKDAIVPPDYTKTVRKKMPFAAYVFIPSYTHDCCWTENWPELLLRKSQ